jgi:ACS family hexuronate transporter-like MFS transporter
MMKRLKGLRWWIVGLICLGTIINYLARNSLAVLAPVLQTKLSFSTQEYSYVVAAFQVGYTVMQSVCGYILDFLGLKLGFALFAVLWSGANLLHALAGGWGSLAFFRGLLGLSEAAAIPAGIKAISEWFPAKERSVAVGYFNAGTSLGALLAPPASHLGSGAIQLADGLHRDRRPGLRLCPSLVAVLPDAEESLVIG